MTVIYRHCSSDRHPPPHHHSSFPFSRSLPVSLSPGSSYFFKGTEYWRVVGSDMEVEAGYPRPIGKDWLVCTDMQSDSPAGETNPPDTRPPSRHPAAPAEHGY